MNIYGIIAAAGSSRSMGQFKPLLSVNGSSMLETAVDGMLEAGLKLAIVVTGHNAEEVEKIFVQKADKRVVLRFNPVFDSCERFDSMKIGLRAAMARLADAMFILPGDMPMVSPHTYEKLSAYMQATKAGVVCPEVNEKICFPYLIHKSCLWRILDYEGGDELPGALRLVSDQTSLLQINDPGCLLDADTPESYQQILEYAKTLRA